MSVLIWIAFGLVVGLFARAIMPGRQQMGIVSTTLLGIAGALLGGFVGSLILGGQPMGEVGMDPYNAAGWIGAVIGALILLGIGAWVQRPAR